jgi:predicted nucleotidyltransferase
MIIHKTLNEIFSTYSNIAVIRELRNTTNGFTGREIAKRAGLSAPAAIKALTHLESLKIVNRRIGGRDHLFTLNFSNYFVKDVILPALEAESLYFEKIKSELRKHLSKESISVILFGSVARKEETIKSDFDICIVYNVPQNKLVLTKILSGLRDGLYNNYGITVAPFLLSTTEFKKRAGSKKSPVDEIIKDGIVLSGKQIQRILNDK